MKKRWILAVAALAMICLSACQQTGSSSTAQSGNTAGGTQSGVTSGNTSGSTSGTQDGSAQPAPSDPGTTSQGDASQAQGDEASQNEPAEDSALAQNTYDVINQSGDLPDPAAAAEATDIAGGQWDGTFSCDSGESVSIETADEYSISFTFAQSGLYGTAEKEGDSALFHGEDNNNIVFELSGDMLYVSITNDNGDPTGDSPLAGSYSRQ